MKNEEPAIAVPLSALTSKITRRDLLDAFAMHAIIVSEWAGSPSLVAELARQVADAMEKKR